MDVRIQRIVDLGARIQALQEELSNKRKELRVLKDELRALVAGGEPAETTSQLRSHSLPERIVDLLKSEPDRAFRADDIYDQLRGLGRTKGSIRTALARLASDRQYGIARVGHGTYQAAGAQGASEASLQNVRTDADLVEESSDDDIPF